jgi:lysophospholipase L1-like esterase
LIADTDYWEGFQGTDYWIKNQRINVTAATYWKMIDLFNQELLVICAERQVACYDLAAQIPHERDYFYDSVHFTEAGANLVAHHVAQAVEELLLDN